MTTIEILIKARAVISDRGRWTQNAEARALYGDSCDCESDAAVCWCAVGATGKVGGYGPSAAADRALEGTLAAAGDGREVVTFNDDPTTAHSMVLDLFDRTIARLQREVNRG